MTKGFKQGAKNVIDVCGIVVTICSMAVTIYVTVIATRADKKLQSSTDRIETLTNRMDSALRRIEPVVRKTDSTLVEILSKEIIKQKPPKQQNDNVPVVSQLEILWREGYDLLYEKKYLEAIERFEKVATQDERFKKDAYYNIAIAYAKLLKEDTNGNKQLYDDLMVKYLKKAADQGDEEAKELLIKYDF